MAIINDTDLLRVELALFTDAIGAALPILSNTGGVISGFNFSSSKVNFESALGEAGGVIIVASQPLEIVDILSGTVLEVTKRRLPDSPLIEPGDGTGLAFQVVSFSMLITEAELWLERTLGLNAHHPQTPLTSDNVLNYDEFASMAAYRVISAAFACAAAADPEDESLRARADLYERMVHDLRQHMVASIDLNDDGVEDERRRMAVGTWVRV